MTREGRVAALVLAAGLSSRMAPRNKLLMADASGQTMVGQVVAAAVASRAHEVVVVTGHQAEDVEHAATEAAGGAQHLRLVRCAGFAQGLSASLKCGIAALGEASAALVCLGDMPLVTSAMLDRLIDAHHQACQASIVVPTCRGTRGNPVLWDAGYFADFAALSGDRGARALLARHADRIIEVELGSEAVLRDFDTPESLGHRVDTF
jgi:molybdenum cofactor cytidylyltransferase